MRTKVIYNLKETPFVFELDGITYAFTSAFHREKYINMYKSKRDEITNFMYRRYCFRMDVNLLSDLFLYKQIETRGFYIIDNKGVSYECLSDIILNGLNLTKQD